MALQQYVILSVLAVSNCARIFAGSVCLSSQDISQCSNSSTWAINVPTLRISHHVLYEYKRRNYISVFYYFRRKDSNLISLDLCEYFLYPNGSCLINENGPTGCLNCSLDSDRVLNVELSVTSIDISINGSTLQCSIQGLLKPIDLQQIYISECPERVGNLVAVSRSANPCGYNCTSKLRRISSGTTVSTETYICNAAAKWVPLSVVSASQLDCNCCFGVGFPGAVMVLLGVVIRLYTANCNDRIFIGGGAGGIVTVAVMIVIVTRAVLSILRAGWSTKKDVNEVESTKKDVNEVESSDDEK